MKVVKLDDGSYGAISAKGEIIERGMTNAQTWRRVDVLTNQPLNRQEETHDRSARMVDR